VLALHTTGDGMDSGRKCLRLWRHGFAWALAFPRGIVLVRSRGRRGARSWGRADRRRGRTPEMETGQEHQRRPAQGPQTQTGRQGACGVGTRAGFPYTGHVWHGAIPSCSGSVMWAVTPGHGTLPTTCLHSTGLSILGQRRGSISPDLHDERGSSITGCKFCNFSSPLGVSDAMRSSWPHHPASHAVETPAQQRLVLHDEAL
jgi:hypothetical protein